MAESVMTLEAKSKGRYEFDGRVRYSEIDHRGTMTLPALINYFQDASTFQSEAIGLGMDRLKHDRKAWVLSSNVREDHYWDICHEVQRSLWKS